MFDLFGGVSREEARGLIYRGLLVLAGLATLVGAVGFLLGWRDVTRIWPFLGYGLVPVFLASILAAIAAVEAIAAVQQQRLAGLRARLSSL